MKKILIVLAMLVLLAACAPQAQPAMPAAQPEPVVEQPPAAVPADQPSAPAPAETASAAGTTHDVDIQGFKFNPAIITVSAGDTVRWNNKDSAPHDATADDQSWATRTPLRKGESDTVTFDTPGTYEYHCAIHSNMKAKVIVQ